MHHQRTECRFVSTNASVLGCRMRLIFTIFVGAQQESNPGPLICNPAMLTGPTVHGVIYWATATSTVVRQRCKDRLRMSVWKSEIWPIATPKPLSQYSPNFAHVIMSFRVVVVGQTARMRLHWTARKIELLHSTFEVTQSRSANYDFSLVIHNNHENFFYRFREKCKLFPSCIFNRDIIKTSLSEIKTRQDRASRRRPKPEPGMSGLKTKTEIKTCAVSGRDQYIKDPRPGPRPLEISG